MSYTSQEKPSSENGPKREDLDKIVLLLVSGLARSAIQDAVAKLGLEGEAASTAIAEARMRIQIAARWEHDDQLGTALIRLNDIYRRSLAAQDTKTALAVQKELNRLLDLRRPPTDSPLPAESPKPTTTDPGRVLPDSAAEIEAAKAYLLPLKLGNDQTPLAELCRLAVLRILYYGRERCISPT